MASQTRCETCAGNKQILVESDDRLQELIREGYVVVIMEEIPRQGWLVKCWRCQSEPDIETPGLVTIRPLVGPYPRYALPLPVWARVQEGLAEVHPYGRNEADPRRG